MKMSFKINEKASVKIPTKIIIPVVAFAIGVIFLLTGITQYGFWNRETSRPTMGFFPIIIAFALVALSALAFVQALGKDKIVEFELQNWLVPIALVAIILMSYITGLVLAIVLFEIFWLRFYEKLSWKTTIIVLAIVLFIVDGCFQMWLGIELPKGFIINLIYEYVDLGVLMMIV